MHTAWLLLIAIATGGSGAPASPVWEKIFDGGDGRDVTLITASARDSWVAGGDWGLVTAREGRVTIEGTHGHGVLGLFTEAPGSVYALGEGELIWHFDGTGWTEEHVAPMPPRGRRQFAAHMLYVAYRAPSVPAGPLVAVGLKLTLVKQPDGRWALPHRAEEDKLREGGLLGPPIAAPARCDRAGWRWLGQDRGAFHCHDGRMFLWDAGTVTPKGKLPPKCSGGPDGLAQAQGELYAACPGPSLWRTEGETWRQIESPRGPKQKTAEGMPSLSYAGGCLFGVADGSAWRRCGP